MAGKKIASGAIEVPEAMANQKCAGMAAKAKDDGTVCIETATGPTPDIAAKKAEAALREQLKQESNA